MQAQDDLELLRQYAREGSQPAFAQLVSRHVNLVYSAALRQVRDPATAEDVTQTVFAALASRAARIRPGTIVAGWLLLTTRFAAKDALRAAGRRQRHERAAALQRAADMRDIEASSSALREAASRDEQSRLEAVLDAVLAKLGPAGRNAVILRFFEGNSLAEVGRRLGISEEAAKKRVGRALAQMRTLLLRRGIALGPEGLGSALGAIAVRPAPSALAAKTSQAAVAGMSVSMAKGALTIMAWTKSKVAAASAVALLLIGGATVGWRVLNASRSSAVKTIVLPPGEIVPAVHFTWQDPEEPEGDKTYHGPPIVGIVRTADGKPVAGATVKLGTWDAEAVLHASPRGKPVPTLKTSSDGRFEFQPRSIPYGVLATCDQGIAVATVAMLTASPDLVIEPWGRVDGTARLGSKPLSKSQVVLWYQPTEETVAAAVDYNGVPQIAMSDESGHFVFNQVPPRLADVTCRFPGSMRAQHSPRFHIRSSTATYVAVGGSGRPIVGRINSPPAEADAHILQLQRVMPEPFQNEDWLQLTTSERAQLYKNLKASPDFAAWERDCNPFQTVIGPDGTFRLEDVPAGKYTMTVVYWKVSHSRYIDKIGDLHRTLTVDPMPGGRSDELLDLGKLDLTPHRHLKIGEPAPELTWRDADRKPTSLRSWQGKYVLGIVLRNSIESDDMWEDLLKLKAVHDRFGSDPRVVMLGLYAGKDFEAACQSAAHDGVAWPLVNVGKSLESVPDAYQSSGEMMFVIDPQGAVLAKDLEPQRAWYVLDQALSHRGTQDGPASVTVRHLERGQDPSSLLPSIGSNAAAHGTFTIVDGIPGKWSAPSILVGGSLPTSDDQRTQNFCFTAATLEGRLKLDLEKTIDIQQITTFSRHKSDRAPQAYTLYVSDGSSSDFDPAPKIGTDPAAHGWTRWANVDSRPTEPARRGGTYAVAIAPPPGNPSRDRYLLFEMFPTETVDQYGHTFYSQIVVTEKSAAAIAQTGKP